MATRSRPDVVVIVLDTARTFDCSAVWQGGPRTAPALERFAEECLVFPQATAPAPWTVPSHASLFTGLMPSGHGATELSVRLAPDGPPTLAELLAAEGWATAGVSCNDLVTPRTGLTRGYQRLVEERDALPTGVEPTLQERLARSSARLRRRADERHRVERMARDHGGERATALVGRVLRETPAGRPLHLFVNYLETHLPYRPDAQWLDGLLPPGVGVEEARTVNQSHLDHVLGRVHHTARDWDTLRGLYRGSMRYVDALTGRLFGMLRAAGRYDGALIVVTSDHGENIGDHGHMDHQASLHDTVLRVPLLVRLPGGAQTGTRDDLAQLIDVVATVCDVTGLPAPPTHGQTLAAPLDREHAVAEYLGARHIVPELRRLHPVFDWAPFERALRSIRTATRKLIWASDGHHELYAVDEDPMETHDLFGGHPDEVRLTRALRRWEQQVGAAPAGGTAAPDPEVTERLAALGYIE